MKVRNITSGFHGNQPTYDADSVDLDLRDDEIREDEFQPVAEVMVMREDRTRAKAFISARRTDRGIVFRLTTKRNEAHDESQVQAVAEFFKPVRPSAEPEKPAD